MPEQHSPFGYSAVSTFEQCPYKYRLQYIDGLKTLPPDDPANPLIIGTALHKALETDLDTAITEYFNSYPIISDKHIDEEIKLRYLIPKVKEILPDGIHEVQVIDHSFIGTLDLLVPVDKNTFDLYDFKYSNNWMRYMDSRQLHLYKYYFEKDNPQKIRNMNFLFVPKVQIRQKKTESLIDFRKRLMKELHKVQPWLAPIEYDPQKVIDHLELTQQIVQCQEYPKNPTRLCDWCEYKKFCEEGDLQNMALPSINEVPITIEDHKKIWVYGEPFSGKTHLASLAPKPILELNTDGNIKHYTMPRIPITDTKDGRQTIPAWEVFKNAVDDLEAGSDFKTIVLDLTEDIYDHCRKYMCDKRGWEHESDDSFKAYDIVRSEFLRVIRKLVNLPYNIILISHQDTGKDITKKSGDKITKISPNITDKVGNKLAGMVDIVIRAIKDGNSYTLSTKTSEVIFGGGRLSGIKAVEVPNSWESIDNMYAQCAPVSPVNATETHEAPVLDEVDTPEAKPTVDEFEDINAKLKEALEPTGEPQRRTRRTRN